MIHFSNSPIGTVTNGFSISNMSLYDMEESFTIHLGSQMKSTHNTRIMSADTLNLLKLTLNENGYYNNLYRKSIKICKINFNSVIK